eukprot:TRINITY_DN84715_c0_g1_i1.p2 TRINITY_DN84715_c0_g1~~TRINITY_DN84715_c0_g1_i1.p2  ORF type:complete len:107 (-),score=9.76 TRINITY_DN84715_c0_g1_i1:8-328(-)
MELRIEEISVKPNGNTTTAIDIWGIRNRVPMIDMVMMNAFCRYLTGPLPQLRLGFGTWEHDNLHRRKDSKDLQQSRIKGCAHRIVDTQPHSSNPNQRRISLRPVDM